MSVNIADYLTPAKLLSRDEKLALDIIRANEADPHLKIIDQEVCVACTTKPCTVTCPVQNYHAEANGHTTIYWESCIECGTCRIICPSTNIAW
jgi:ferredoxin like protein